MAAHHTRLFAESNPPKYACIYGHFQDFPENRPLAGKSSAQIFLAATGDGKRTKRATYFLVDMPGELCFVRQIGAVGDVLACLGRRSVGVSRKWHGRAYSIPARKRGGMGLFHDGGQKFSKKMRKGVDRERHRGMMRGNFKASVNDLRWTYLSVRHKI